MEEIYKDIEDFVDYYQVSNSGKYKRLSRVVPHAYNSTKFLKEKILTLRISNAGYYGATLHKDGKVIQRFIHREVAKAFIPNPLGLPEVNHIDGNRLNNNVWNLEWTDRIGNIRHAIKIGLMNSSGENNKNHKLTQKQVNEIREALKIKKVGIGIELSKKYNVSRSVISNIKNNKRWTLMK